MIKEDNFFKNHFINSSNFSNSLKKTKKVFKFLLIDLKKKKIPSLEPYDKSYEFYFSKKTVKNFSKYQNIIIIGMGGSILGTKSIYSILKKKIKKKVFFF